METLTMAKKKKQPNPNEQLAKAIIDQYQQPQNVEDMHRIYRNLPMQQTSIRA